MLVKAKKSVINITITLFFGAMSIFIARSVIYALDIDEGIHDTEGT